MREEALPFCENYAMMTISEAKADANAAKNHQK